MYIVSGARPLTSILTSVASFLRLRSAWPVMVSAVFSANDANLPFSCLSTPLSAPALATAIAVVAVASNVTAFLMCLPLPVGVRRPNHGAACRRRAAGQRGADPEGRRHRGLPARRRRGQGGRQHRRAVRQARARGRLG